MFSFVVAKIRVPEAVVEKNVDVHARTRDCTALNNARVEPKKYRVGILVKQVVRQ